MHAKPLITKSASKTKNYLIMRNLTSIGAVTADKIKPDELNPSQRIQLSINLLRALQTIHNEYKAVHNDIKSDNIMINKNSLEVYVIDFGLSNFSNNNSQRNKDRTNMLQIIFSMVLADHCSDGINGDQDIEVVIELFEQMRLKTVLEQLPPNALDIQSAIELAHKEALNTYKKLKDIEILAREKRSKNDSSTLKSALNDADYESTLLEELRKAIIVSICRVSDHGPALELFAQSLNITALQELDSKNKMIAIVNTVLDNYLELRHELLAMRNELTAMIDNSGSSPSLTMLRRDINRLLLKPVHADRKLRFDDISEITNRYSEAILQLRGRLSDIVSIKNALLSSSTHCCKA